MPKAMGLRARLLFSHLLVAVVSLSCYILINRLAAWQYCVAHFDNSSQHQIDIAPLLWFLVENFSSTWHRGVLGAVLVGLLSALILSYWMTRRITAPLLRMGKMPQTFAAGELGIRLPASPILEINRLRRSFNRMALRLEQVEQKRRDLVGDLAHELRTPLTIVRGYLEELADERLQPTAEMFHRIIGEVHRLERLVLDLQFLSKAEVGNLSLQLQSFSLGQLLEQVNATFTTQLLEDGPTLMLSCLTDLPPVWADRDRTEQILCNLIGNAFSTQNRAKLQFKLAMSNARFGSR